MTHRLAVLSLVLVLMGCGGSRSTGLVRPGIEVLLSDSAHLVAGRRVGLLTNQTGVDRAGTPDVERLLDAGVQLTAILTPEHGYRGILDEENIDHGVDPATGIPLYSLYGAVRAPTRDMLNLVDVLLIDLQDIGARPYTYISTTLLAMRAGSGAGVPVVVLDRPNPIAGNLVQGPVLVEGAESFNGMLEVSLRHGMTLGELALYGNEELALGAELTVVPADGWRREMWFDQTGLPWIRPSPNMPDLESATHYPGLVLFEATNLSVGRGTPMAFQVVGAPWLEPAAIVEALDSLVGATATDTVVTPIGPTDGKHGGQEIRVVKLRVTDRSRYNPVTTALALLVAVKALHGDSLRINPDRFDQLAGGVSVRSAVEAGVPAGEIVASWRPYLDGFRQTRNSFLLYE